MNIITVLIELSESECSDHIGIQKAHIVFFFSNLGLALSCYRMQGLPIATLGSAKYPPHPHGSPVINIALEHSHWRYPLNLLDLRLSEHSASKSPGTSSSVIPDQARRSRRGSVR